MMLLVTVLLASGLLSALTTAVLLGQLRRRGVQQAVRDDGPETHLQKSSTPTMGGLAVILSIAVVVLLGGLATDVAGLRLYLVVAAMLAYALVGLYDDLSKTGTGNPTGWRARYKIVAETAAAILFLVGLVLLRDDAGPAWHTEWLWLWVPLGLVALVGGANAVNLTDGLDGLAAGLTTLCGLAMAALLAMRGDMQMALVAAAIAGAAAGFLWLNAHPARIFMGDVGSLGLGAALAAVAVAARMELLFGLIAAVFVWETLSVMIQVAYFRRTGGKRVFRMAPFHHHLELYGWPEPTVVTRLWLVGAVCALLGILIGVATWVGGAP
ncbi:MAG: phospho-N-acetylmuramoyl-pentapeptide-transferase [candidate division WS1 bacterium]|jgi:phospho-N-acetylmuramoyl-pentapeptide-transferase|nr:phospho-N-acetylmuramoyl-pentapeptide-transferase [candidate division WS1 bacterium]